VTASDVQLLRENVERAGHYINGPETLAALDRLEARIAEQAQTWARLAAAAATLGAAWAEFKNALDAHAAPADSERKP